MNKFEKRVMTAVLADPIGDLVKELCEEGVTFEELLEKTKGISHLPESALVKLLDGLRDAIGVAQSKPKKKRKKRTLVSTRTVVRKASFNGVSKLVGKGEAIVFMGCGGPLSKWTNGIRDAVAGMVPSFEWYTLTTTGDRTELVLLLPSEGVDMGRLSIWKIGFGDCSWWSDYRTNYRDQHK